VAEAAVPVPVVEAARILQRMIRKKNLKKILMYSQTYSPKIRHMYLLKI